jgi:CheY-like chemotaxis protein
MKTVSLPVILLAEDNPKDVTLTMRALAKNNLANSMVVTRDGVEAMEYLRCEGDYRSRERGNPAVLLLDIKMPRKDGLEVLREIAATRPSRDCRWSSSPRRARSRT